MGIAATVQHCLRERGVTYEAVEHPPTLSSTETAEACHIPSDCLAKSVVLRRGVRYLLALLPASRHLRLGEIRAWLDDDVTLATEEEIRELFPDCEPGAVPAVGDAYGLGVIMDDSLSNQPEVYFEGGDHATLVHLKAADFRRLLGNVPHAQFSVHH